MSITSDIQAALDRGMNPPETAAAYVLDRVSKAALREYCTPMAENDARDLARRMVEKKARLVFSDDSLTLVEQGRALAAESFYLPDGRVLIGEATPEQLRQRAAMQRKLAGTILADAEHLERLADAIEEAGVRCLNEMEQATSPPKPTHVAPAPRKRRAPVAEEMAA